MQIEFAFFGDSGGNELLVFDRHHAVVDEVLGLGLASAPEPARLERLPLDLELGPPAWGDGMFQSFLSIGDASTLHHRPLSRR